MTQDLDALLKLARVIRDRDLSDLANAKKQVQKLAGEHGRLSEEIDEVLAQPADLEWPGANEKWLLLMRLKDAHLRAELAEAKGAAQPFQARARQSFGRAVVLEKLAKKGRA